MYANPMNTYETVHQMTMPGREIEAAVLGKAAGKLEHCQRVWEDAERDALLEEALKFNQKVWSIFQAELADETNPLPRKLRWDILQLGGFIDRRILDVMAAPAPEKLNIIININRNLAAGLRGSPRD